GGFLFGVILAAMVILPKYRATLAVALGLTLATSVAPLFWNPNSHDWLALQIVKAQDKGDLSRAETYYKTYLDKGGDRVWAWYGLALIYGARGEKAPYRQAVQMLRDIDRDAADQVVAAYGPIE
ncbi:MAG: hypothetical protein ACAH95_13720, partial [Fimbriimonas sp.]